LDRRWGETLRILRRVAAGLGRAEFIHALGVAALQVTETLGIVATVYVFSSDARTAAFAGTAVLAAVFAARRALAALLLRRVRGRLVEETTQTILATEMDRSSLLGAEDATLAVFEGLHFAERIIVDHFPGLGAALAASVVIAAALGYAAPRNVLILAGLAVLVGAGVMFASRRIITRYSELASEAFNRVSDGIVASVAARVDLVANGRDREFLQTLRADTRRWCDHAMRADRISSLAGRAPIFAAALAVATVVGIDSTLRGEVLATGLARSALYASAVPPFLAVARIASQLVRDAVRLRGFIEILSARRSPAGGGPGVPLPPFPSTVEWRAVSFHYFGDADSVEALHHVSVSWAPGRSLVVAGPNGSGKSTLLRLLLGLYPPSSGNVTVAGVDVLSLDLQAWRSSAAYLGQRPYLLDRATVRETIAVMAPNADDARIRAALERLAVWGDLERKSPHDPLSTLTGALSVGQKQRVLLAHALAQDARLIVLDEPDANLDAAGVRIVAGLVNELALDRMVVVAAHTPELAAAGGLLVELERGRTRSVVDHTSHDSGASAGHRS